MGFGVGAGEDKKNGLSLGVRPVRQVRFSPHASRAVGAKPPTVLFRHDRDQGNISGLFTEMEKQVAPCAVVVGHFW